MNTTSDFPDDFPPSSIIACFRDLPDPRVDRTRDHELGDILVIALCTLLCGGDTFTDMQRFGEAKKAWLQTFLRLPAGIPSHDTFTGNRGTGRQGASSGLAGQIHPLHR